MKPIARTGDARSEPSPALQHKCAAVVASGGWNVLGDVLETALPVARSDGRSAIRSATCTFQFVGTLPDGTPCTAVSTVTLAPTVRELRICGHDPLLDGDSAEDDFGNRISISSSARWRTH